jgi:flavin reductase (DIM6/NTAB) family NADH-FMN oxidoreductase RutF
MRATVSVDEDFGDLMGTLDYPMVIVTAASAAGRAGCLAGFVTQASIHPPRLLVHLSKANRTYRIAEGADVLVVHYLQRANMDLAHLFGEETGDDVDKFERCAWDDGPSGTPVLSGTLGWVAGPILDRLDAGDHVAHLVGVTTVTPPDPATTGAARPVLTYQSVREFDPGHPA